MVLKIGSGKSRYAGTKELKFTVKFCNLLGMYVKSPKPDYFVAKVADKAVHQEYPWSSWVFQYNIDNTKT